MQPKNEVMFFTFQIVGEGPAVAQIEYDIQREFKFHFIRSFHPDCGFGGVLEVSDFVVIQVHVVGLGQCLT